MTSPQLPAVPATALTTPVSYEDLVLHNLIRFRGPDGSRRDTFTTVANPALSPEVRATRQQLGRRDGAAMWTAAVCWLGSVVGLGASIGASDGHLLLFTLPALGASTAASATASGFDRRCRRFEEEHSFRLRVPTDVADAYTAFLGIPDQLRANGAEADVITDVAAQTELAHALVVEIAVLARRDASHTVAYGQLCDRLVHLGAQARAILTLDQRRTELAAVVGDSTSLLAQEQANLGRAADRVAAEVTHLTRVLDPDAVGTLPALTPADTPQA